MQREYTLPNDENTSKQTQNNVIDLTLVDPIKILKHTEYHGYYIADLPLLPTPKHSIITLMHPNKPYHFSTLNMLFIFSYFPVTHVLLLRKIK